MDLGMHRQQAGNLVLTPRGVEHAGTSPRLFGASLEPTSVNEHYCQPRDDRYLGRSPLLLEDLGPSIPFLLQSRAYLVGDSLQLAVADGDLGLIGERFGGCSE